MCLCLGPTGSGKTLLLRKLQNQDPIDLTTVTVPTIGTNIVEIHLKNMAKIMIRELGGEMAPIWKNYYNNVKKIIYVVDASNLCQISAAGVLLYGILAESALRNIKILLVLTKMDVSYRQMRNEALLMMQFERLKKEVTQELVVIEASARNGLGMDQILAWLENKPVTQALGKH